MTRRTTRAELWIQDPFCFVCGNFIERYSESSIEHIVPLAKGGTNDQHNLAVSHQICNQIKSDSLHRAEWQRKIEIYHRYGNHHWLDEKVAKIHLSDVTTYQIIKDIFCRFEFIKLNFHIIRPNFHEELQKNRLIRKSLHSLQKYSRDDLIITSEILELKGTMNYWNLFFGIFFMQLYQKNFDRVAMLHAILRLDTFKSQLSANLTFWLFADTLLDICCDFEPVVFEKYQNLRLLKSLSCQKGMPLNSTYQCNFSIIKNLVRCSKS